MDYIRARLQALAAERGVRILFAIESGSRAWGFPSADSDYDVRFVYVRTREEYLSLHEHREVIETPIQHDAALGVPFDLNGWDLRKALRLALRSNAVLGEWLSSPVCYLADPEALAEIRAFAAAAASPDEIAYHYHCMGHRPWEEIQRCASTEREEGALSPPIPAPREKSEGALNPPIPAPRETSKIEERAGEVEIKRYLYALRAAVALAWIHTRGVPVPMYIGECMGGLALPSAVEKEVARLIARRATATEHARCPRNASLDAFLGATYAERAPRPVRAPPAGQAGSRRGLAEAGDRLFRLLLR
jgi:hypothetical protein